MNKEYEKILTLRNENGELVGMWVHDAPNDVNFYLVNRAGLDEIKELEYEQKETQLH